MLEKNDLGNVAAICNNKGDESRDKNLNVLVLAIWSPFEDKRNVYMLWSVEGVCTK